MCQLSEEQFRQFVELCRDAVRQQVAGGSAAFHALWSHDDDVVLMGAAGSHQVGWADVDPHLTWASEHLHYNEFEVENLLTLVGDELAVTVDLEHMNRSTQQGLDTRTLRVTQVYRVEQGRWRVAVRHGDPMDTPVGLGGSAPDLAHTGG